MKTKKLVILTVLCLLLGCAGKKESCLIKALKDAGQVNYPIRMVYFDRIDSTKTHIQLQAKIGGVWWWIRVDNSKKISFTDVAPFYCNKRYFSVEKARTTWSNAIAKHLE